MGGKAVFNHVPRPEGWALLEMTPSGTEDVGVDQTDVFASSDPNVFTPGDSVNEKPETHEMACDAFDAHDPLKPSAGIRPEDLLGEPPSDMALRPMGSPIDNPIREETSKEVEAASADDDMDFEAVMAAEHGDPARTSSLVVVGEATPTGATAKASSPVQTDGEDRSALSLIDTTNYLFDRESARLCCYQCYKQFTLGISEEPLSALLSEKVRPSSAAAAGGGKSKGVTALEAVLDVSKQPEERTVVFCSQPCLMEFRKTERTSSKDASTADGASSLAEGASALASKESSVAEVGETSMAAAIASAGADSVAEQPGFGDFLKLCEQVSTQ